MKIETFGELKQELLNIKSKKDAEIFIKNNLTNDIDKSNVGYVIGYFDKKKRDKLYSLLNLNHPIFGSSI